MIKKAELTDVERLSQLATLAYGKYVERMGLKPAPMCADFAHHIQHDKCYVLQQQNQLAAYIVYKMLSNALFIENVAVHPDFSGHRLGQSLMQFAENQALQAGITQATLYTNESMTENLSLYPKIGYIETDRRQEHGFNRVYFLKNLVGKD